MSYRYFYGYIICNHRYYYVYKISPKDSKKMIKTIFVLMILVPNIAYSYDEYLSNSEVQEFIEHMHEKYDYDKKN